ncbi:unnamed protein product [Leptosia nina]|uniref:Uncharacterized protein n=1 Tax=Leptosia nina TaxID=320188 RepID=A0AAV1J1L8_9NEOP
MDKVYEYAKSAIVHFKLERCCCLAPIRIGVIIMGYFNVFVGLLSLVGTADGGITPPLMAVQELILEDNASKPLGVIAYTAEVGFNMVLLCGIYRNDVVLLRIYIYFVVVAVVSSILVYSMVIALISILTKLLIFGSIAFQFYIILLVRSAIVEIKESNATDKNGHAVIYSVVRDSESKVEIKLPSEQGQEIEKKELEDETVKETENTEVKVALDENGDTNHNSEEKPESIEVPHKSSDNVK